MKNLFVSIILSVIISLFYPVTGLAEHPTNTNNFYLPLAEIRPGMKGVGRTIFQGDKLEDFGVEILGVLPGLTGSPKRSVIIVKLSGPAAERTGVFAGMSGSPVFVNGKLIGAMAFSFPFSKEPLGAITPIEDIINLLDLPDESATTTLATTVNAATVTFADLLVASLNPDTISLAGGNVGSIANHPPLIVGPQAASLPSLAPYVGQTLMPIATPLAVNGIDPTVLQFFTGRLQQLGLQPVTAAMGNSPIAPLEPYTADTLTPGKKITVDLLRGDFSLAASGTVTWRDGEKIYAFGHPFFAPGGAGRSEWPMTEGSVITVVPHLINSFNVATPGKVVGMIQQDRATGIYGKLGQAAKMVPLRISVAGSRGQQARYQMEMVSDASLTPLLVQIATIGSIFATERTFGEQTISVEGRIQLKNQPQINFGTRFSSNAAAFILAAFYSGYPLSVLYGSGFSMDIENVELNIKTVDRRLTGAITRIEVDRTEVKRGETLNLQITARNDRGQALVQTVPVTIPATAPLGRLNITVGDGGVMANLERRNAVYLNPTNLTTIVESINNLPKTDHLYVKLYYNDNGVVVSNQQLPSLPPSMLATLDSARSTTDYLSLPIATVLDQEIPLNQFLTYGQQTITVKVIN
jgi:SpoIVB peptidase S55